MGNNDLYPYRTLGLTENTIETVPDNTSHEIRVPSQGLFDDDGNTTARIAEQDHSKPYRIVIRGDLINGSSTSIER